MTIRVYPRVCGGTAAKNLTGEMASGLSPRVRGNRADPAGAPGLHRSIPACAGEPRCPGSRLPVTTVYPRVCGGTSQVHGHDLPLPGLSPRVRGNLLPGGGTANQYGSIPACAGEPSPPRLPRCRVRVYPRVCGGTRYSPTNTPRPAGLSPRVRGNQRPSKPSTIRTRSIPACAGEPPSWRCRRCCCRVYPRVCGGTASALRFLVIVNGLSPRVRGNRGRPARHLLVDGSIPACAGEP